jgi:hypothetical protein
VNRTVADMYVLQDKQDPSVFYSRFGENFYAGSFGDAVLYTRSDALLALDPGKELFRQYKAVQLSAVVHMLMYVCGEIEANAR